MTTCPTCGQPTDEHSAISTQPGYTLVSVNGKRQKIVQRVELTPFKGVRVEGEYLGDADRFVDFRSIPLICVVAREEEYNDSIAEDHRLDRVVPGMGDRRVEVVNENAL